MTKYLFLLFLFTLALTGCQQSTGIQGNNNDDNQVVTGNNSQIVNDNNVTNNNTTINKVEPAESPPPPDIEGTPPIISMGNENHDGCEGPRASLVTVAEHAKDDRNNDVLPTLLQGEDSIRETYYLDIRSLSNADRSWVSAIFVPGRRLKIEYYVCGSGGIRNLVYVEALRASR
jgi:hypothetical protein